MTATQEQVAARPVVRWHFENAEVEILEEEEVPVQKEAA